MRYLHTMVRVSDLDASLDFYVDKLGLKEVRRHENQQGRYTLVFLAADENPEAQVELTYNWDPEVYTGGRNFGHLAYSVPDIYATCQQLMDKGVTINRPPRDGRMAFIKSPDGISIELLQQGEALPAARAVDLDAERRQLVVFDASRLIEWTGLCTVGGDRVYSATVLSEACAMDRRVRTAWLVRQRFRFAANLASAVGLLLALILIVAARPPTLSRMARARLR